MPQYSNSYFIRVLYLVEEDENKVVDVTPSSRRIDLALYGMKKHFALPKREDPTIRVEISIASHLKGANESHTFQTWPPIISS